ncbi:MAG: hypothetical protein Fur0022_38490 [Anaerolineales bacterium]
MQPSENTRGFSWLSLLQFSLSGLAILMLWGIAGTFAVVALVPVFGSGSLRRVDASGFLLAAGLAWIGLLLVPSAWFALLRLINRPVNLPVRLTWRKVGGLIWLMIPVVLAGYGASVTPEIGWLLLPPLNVLALSIPTVWYLALGGRGLRSSSPQSAWGVFGAGLMLGPGLILFFELMGGVIAVVVLVFWLAPLPGFTEELQQLMTLVQSSPTLDPSDLLPFAEKYLLRESVLVGGLLFIAGFVPLLEEFLKPVGMWLMNKQTLTPARGFLAGMLSGAAFGLFESLLQGVSGEAWITLAIARSGTSLIHIFNSGLVGWGFALAWQQRSLWPWLTRFAVAVLIHGLWNGNTVMIALALTPGQDLVGEGWGIMGGSMLVVLSVGCFIALLIINRRLQREVQTAEEPPAPVAESRELPPHAEE